LTGQWGDTEATGIWRDVSLAYITGFGVNLSTMNTEPLLWIWQKPHCRADLNNDGLVDFVDFLVFLNYYIAQDPRADFNQDGLIDFSDYLEFLNLYDAGC